MQWELLLLFKDMWMLVSVIFMCSTWCIDLVVMANPYFSMIFFDLVVN